MEAPTRDPTPLALPDRTPAQDHALRSTLEQAPGGRFLVDHVDDGPYHLVTIRQPDDDVHWQAAPFLAAAPRFEVPLSDMGAIEATSNVFLLTQLGYEIVSWYGGDDGQIWVDQNYVTGPYETIPTTADLARHFAAMLDEPITNGSADPNPASPLAAVLLAHQDQVTTTIPPLLSNLALQAADNDELVAMLTAVLRPAD